MHPKQSPGIMLVTMESPVRHRTTPQPISVLILTIQRHRSCGERHSAQLSSMYGQASRSLDTHVMSAHLDVVRHHTTHTYVSHNELLYIGLHTNTDLHLCGENQNTVGFKVEAHVDTRGPKQTWRRSAWPSSTLTLMANTDAHNTRTSARMLHFLSPMILLHNSSLGGEGNWDYVLHLFSTQ